MAGNINRMWPPSGQQCLATLLPKQVGSKAETSFLKRKALVLFFSLLLMVKWLQLWKTATTAASTQLLSNSYCLQLKVSSFQYCIVLCRIIYLISSCYRFPRTIVIRNSEVRLKKLSVSKIKGWKALCLQTYNFERLPSSEMSHSWKYHAFQTQMLFRCLQVQGIGDLLYIPVGTASLFEFPVRQLVSPSLKGGSQTL